MKIIDKLKEQNNFTHSEKEVAAYILKNTDKVKEMTIKDLAQACYSSNPTIIRMCRRLGFSGFKPFKVALMLEIEASKFAVNDVNMDFPFGKDANIQEIGSALSSLYKETIDLVNSQIDYSNLEKVIDVLIQSENVFLFAFGDSKIAAESFVKKMIRIKKYPQLASEDTERMIFANNITSKDCAFFVTYSGHLKAYETCINIIKSKGAKVVVLTAHEDSYIARKSDYLITFAEQENTVNIARFYSQLATEYLLNIVYAGFYNKNYVQNSDHKNRVYEDKRFKY